MTNITDAARVPRLDLQAQSAPPRLEILAAIVRVCDARQFILGPKVDAAAAEALALPIYPGLTRDQQQHVVSCVAEAVR